MEIAVAKPIPIPRAPRPSFRPLRRQETSLLYCRPLAQEKSESVKMEFLNVPGLKRAVMSKKHEIVLFSATAIALYGYDQGTLSGKTEYPRYIQHIFKHCPRHDVFDQYQL